MSTPILAMIPSGVKAAKLYSVLPTDGTGDFTVARAGLKHKVNSDLNLELIAATVPSLNYDAIGGCPVLNTEPQATNLITYPISFDNAYWTKSGATIDDNGGAGYSSPSVDFPTSAFKLVESSADEQHRVFTSPITTTTSSPYSRSVFAKAGERGWVSVETNAGTGTWFDLINGVVGTDNNTSSSITALANGWYKCTTTLNAIAVNDRLLVRVCSADNQKTYTGDGTSGVYIFMAQLETGSAATSPTFTDITLAAEGSTTTRLADGINTKDISSFSSINFYLFIDFNYIQNQSETIFQIDDGVNYIYLFNLSLYLQDTIVNTLALGQNKILIRNDATNLTAFVNGVQTASVSRKTTLLNNLKLRAGLNSTINYNKLQYGTDITDLKAIILTTL